MMDYIYDETIYSRFDHVDIIDSMPGDPETAYIVKLYLTDGEIREYGLYDYYKAKKVVDKIVDDNVIYKFPFLKKPLTADKVNVDGASRLIAALIRDAKESYISQARNLKKFGFSVPTSMKEYRESNINKRVSNRLKEIDESINDIIKIPEDDRTERDNMVLEKLKDERLKLEGQLGGLYSTIRFVEEGFYGALGLLNSGISGQEILNEWKKEALGYVKKSQKRYYSRN